LESLEATAPQGSAASQKEITSRLAEQEAKLKEAESVIRVLQVQGQGQQESTESQTSSSKSEPLQRAQDLPSKSAVGPIDRASVVAASDPHTNYPVKVYQVNDELEFLVFSFDSVEKVHPGTQLLLLSQDKPVMTVELTELDSAGFVVAQITRTLEPGRPIRKGDMLTARPLQLHP